MDELPKRKALRLQDFDYASNACYFITICTKNKQMLFGTIVDNVSRRVGTPYMASAPPQGVPTRLSSVIGSYKASVTRGVGTPVWQGRYYDHVIRDELDYLEKANYIANNPQTWLLGEE